jgi:hypothetical protein
VGSNPTADRSMLMFRSVIFNYCFVFALLGSRITDKIFKSDDIGPLSNLEQRPHAGPNRGPRGRWPQF